MQTISIHLLEAAMRGGLSVPGPAIMTDDPGSPYAVHIPALDSLPDTFWVTVDHGLSPCGPHPDDGLCGACENLAERLEDLVGLLDTDDVAYADNAYDAYSRPVWKPHPVECRCEVCWPLPEDEAAALAEHSTIERGERRS